ncbi:glycoside hydrolase family 95 protein [Galbibacter pacificus]|uniref:Glycoside hydrolase family 95 protein n=1 Tax=Galbibacter pacificus TaxID=2996052 RepID=A0ABT6FPL4_9FLAO|nr:glycoside hydrolase family 95 protein [Galbibacter pacificus]MDG3582325.1 glycoside hydrolase family 95 protein [Galbibacter pacificus]MDG3585199.1 glycoside hydrolase family 95 protein [Galbibacter pacificus]
MKLKYLGLAFMAMFLSSCKEASVQKENSTTDIWYKQPAKDWMQALPVGNGRLGAMVFGDTNKEHIQLNEDSMWPGGANLGNSKGTPEDLKELRRLIDEGKVHEADKFIVDKFSFKGITRSHQTAGDLLIDFKHKGKVTKYKRGLSFANALASVTYEVDGELYTEKVIASRPDDALVIQLETSAGAGMDFDLQLSRPDDAGKPTVEIHTPEENEMVMNGTVTQLEGKVADQPHPMKDGVHFQTRLKAKTDSGTIKSNNGKLELRGVKKAVIYLVTQTSFYHEEFEKVAEENMAKASLKPFDELLKKHTEDFGKLYNRMAFKLGRETLDSLPTDERLQKFKAGKPDLDLEAKLFQYGRYLLISCSRPGTNPANLQGLWNNHIVAPWNADYHLNINLQMNYWPAGVTNLSECQLPLFDFADKLVKRGEVTAKEQYGINRGAVVHHTTDIWAPTFMRAAQPFWGSWIHGGGWLAQHYWEQYRFTQDTAFLKERAYPYLKEMALFYLDWLQKDQATGQWISYPETSPENSYLATDGKPAAVSRGTAMGQQIIAEVFANTLQAATVLNIEDDFIAEVKAKQKDLKSGVIIGKDGRILEWDKQYDEPEKGHRHISHLYALHPGDDITEATPEAFEAAKKTIAYRLEHGGAGTGWSRAWMINFNARLLDKQSAEENINKFFEISLADNLFDEHPPFQIDGNFGYTAGVAELLLQSHEGFLRILPTLPENWKTGKISRLIARGNIEVGITWNNGKLVTLTLLSPINKSVDVKYGSTTKTINLKANTKMYLGEGLNKIEK